MKTLVIPDVHEDIEGVASILDKEESDRIVFLGDWFDTVHPIADIQRTASFMMDLYGKSKQGDVPPITWLVGNHDIAYFEYFYLKRTRGFEQLNFCCKGFNRSKGDVVNKVLTLDFIKQHKLCVFVDGWLLSHAGVMPNIIPYTGDDTESLEKFLYECESVYADFPYVPPHNPILGAGMSRGGHNVVGGVMWCDWNVDFIDALPWPQLVGHTKGPEVKKTGNSYCIDTGLNHYAVITDGKLEIKAVK